MSRVLLAIVALAAVVLLVAGLIGLFTNHEPNVPAESQSGTRAVAAGRPVAMPLPSGYTVLEALPDEQYAQVERGDTAGAGKVLVTSPNGTLVLPALPDEKLGSAASTASENKTE